MLKKITFVIVCFVGFIAFPQATIKGTVFDEYLEPFAGATINSNLGSTTSDFNGEFTLNIKDFPVTLKVTSIGYSSETILISEAGQEINVILKETYGLDQIVISASRTPERVMESPVTIERIDKKYMKNTGSPNFYESLKNLKGINILDNNFSTKIVVSNRGFANVNNTRFVQLIDGVDTSVPVFDYSFGNVFGINELDVETVEILPGPSSALYGANAINGILTINSKNPFDYEGVSIYNKTGFTNADNRGNKGFYDVGIRLANKFNDWFAAKVNINYETSEDWVADDNSNINGIGTSHTNANTDYDGVNVYGDDYAANLVDLTFAGLLTENDAGQSLFEQQGLSNQDVVNALLSTPNAKDVEITRTGIAESDLVDYKNNNFKIDASFHFRPWGEDKTEIILGTKYNVGDNVATGSNRYFQENSNQQQYRFEFKGLNYFFRGYYTQNSGGKNTFDSKLAATYMNRQVASDLEYFAAYLGQYYGNFIGGASDINAHINARNAVDTAYGLDPSSNEFNQLLNNAKNTFLTDPEGGAKLFEESGFYNVDANYNFADIIDFADIQTGGSFRSFALDSEGQVYTDYDGILRYRLFGFYTQIQKKFADDRLKFSGTLRYDKSKNFEGKFSPRATISYAAGDRKDHNFRIGYQTGFRNPTSRDQYAGLLLGGNTVLLGSVDDNLDRYEITPVNGNGVVITGRDAFENSITANSLEEFQDDFKTQFLSNPSDLLADPQNPAVIASYITPSLLEVSNFETLKPETIRSLELGYRGAIDLAGSIFEYDIVGFYDTHKNFITSTEVVVPYSGNVNSLTNNDNTDDLDLLNSLFQESFQRFIISTNAKSTIKVYGFSAGFTTKLFNKFNFGASYAFSDFNINRAVDEIDFKPAFNTPKNSLKFHLNTEKLFMNFGFGIDARWHSDYLYQTRIFDATIDQRFVLDTQINYTVPSINSTFKLGATNITGKNYISVPESGTIGSQYYISWTIE